ncbi:MAG TPA: radical SAM protein [bacterium]|nr:radical SAM protein [bacterium]
MKVVEVFHSIQGESTHAGLPCVFVRLSGCNLRCSYCDTQYAYDEGERMSLDEILVRVQRYDCPLVEITGGEPLLQEQTPQLTSQLAHKGYTVLVETNGTVDISGLDKRAIRIMDIKCPGSGCSDKTLWSNVELLRKTDEVKMVLCDERDYLWARGIIEKFNLLERTTVLLSPVHGRLEPAQLAAWILRDRLNVRLQLQLHKYIWNPETRGV